MRIESSSVAVGVAGTPETKEKPNLAWASEMDHLQTGLHTIFKSQV